MTIECKFLWLSRLFRKTGKNFAFKVEKAQSTNVFSKSAGFFAPHQRAAPFRREEPLRQLFHAFVFLQVISQFVLTRLILEMPSTLSRPYLKCH
jgi:hypothetical protein